MNDMKMTVASMMVVAAMLVQGCTMTRVRRDGDSFKLTRITIFHNTGIPELTVATNGTITLKGYNQAGDKESLKELGSLILTAPIPTK